MRITLIHATEQKKAWLICEADEVWSARRIPISHELAESIMFWTERAPRVSGAMVHRIVQTVCTRTPSRYIIADEPGEPLCPDTN